MEALADSSAINLSKSTIMGTCISQPSCSAHSSELSGAHSSYLPNSTPTPNVSSEQDSQAIFLGRISCPELQVDSDTLRLPESNSEVSEQQQVVQQVQAGPVKPVTPSISDQYSLGSVSLLMLAELDIPAFYESNTEVLEQQQISETKFGDDSGFEYEESDQNAQFCAYGQDFQVAESYQYGQSFKYDSAFREAEEFEEIKHSLNPMKVVPVQHTANIPLVQHTLDSAGLHYTIRTRAVDDDNTTTVASSEGLLTDAELLAFGLPIAQASGDTAACPPRVIYREDVIVVRVDDWKDEISARRDAVLAETVSSDLESGYGI